MIKSRKILGSMSLVTAALIVLAAAVLFTGVAGALTAPAATARFADLAENAAEYPFVNWLAGEGLMVGYPDGTFRPAASITRAEMAALLVRAAGLAAARPETATFTDVRPGHWAYGVIETAAAAGLVVGYPDGTFQPGEPVTRAETAALILRLTQAPEPENVVLPAVVRDMAPGHWAARSVAIALDAGLLQMAARHTFAPGEPATRAQAARGLATMLNIAPEYTDVPLTGVLIQLAGEVTLTRPGQEPHKITTETVIGVHANVKTGPDGRAEVNFPDGSGLLIEPNTEFNIKEARGQRTILRDGSPGMLVDRLELDQPKGRLFIAVAATYVYLQAKEIVQSPPAIASYNVLSAGTGQAQPALGADGTGFSSWTTSGMFLAAATGNVVQTPEQELPWWKKTFAKRARVQVDMPWGVAGIRGTFAATDADYNRLSVMDGEGQLTSDGEKEDVGAGQESSVGAPTGGPSPASAMSPDEQQAWAGAGDWVRERAQDIQESMPAVIPPLSVEEQGEPETTPPQGREIAAGILDAFGKIISQTEEPVEQKPVADGGGSDTSPSPGGGTPAPSPSSAKEIISYSFAAQTGPATINTGTGTVTIEVAHGTDVTALVATFTLSADAIATVGGTPQVSGTTENDFNSPVTYVVTAEDGSTKEWTVTVTVAAADPELPPGYIPVATAEELYNIRLNEENTFGAGTPWEGTYTGGLDKQYIQVAEDINLNVAPYNQDVGWEPIGSSGDPFTGIFDGGGYTITGLYINRPEQDWIGLFGRTKNAVIKNLGLVDVNITGQTLVGGLVGEMGTNIGENSGAITGCYVTGSIEGNNKVGGLAGQSYDPITGSHSSVAVTGNNMYIGGLVGYGMGDIENSHATGNVTGAAGSWYVGGLAGVFDSGSLADSYAEGNVRGDVRVGGLVGSAGGSIIRSYALGDVVWVDYFNSYNIGGLVGLSGAEIENCFATGYVSAYFNAGGLVGDNSGSITDSFATGDAGGMTSVGGLVGTNSGAGTIENCYATGAVSGESGLGGLVGENIGDVESSYYDSVSSGQSDDEGKGIPKTTVEMQQGSPSPEIYTGWSEVTWQFTPVDQYPILIWTLP